MKQKKNKVVQPVICSVVKGISGQGIKDKDIWITISSSAPSFKQYWDY